MKIAIPVLGFLFVCLFILCSIDISRLRAEILSASIPWLIAAFGITATQPFLTSLRLYIYLRAGGQQKPYTLCVKAGLAASSLNAVLPAKGGDLVKVTFMMKSRDELQPLAGLTLLERFFDILILCLFALAGSIFIGNETTTLLSCMALCAPVGAILLLGKASEVPLVGKKLFRLSEACRQAFKSPVMVLRGCLIACVCWGTNLAVMFCLFKAVGAGVNFPSIAASTPLAIFIGLLPVSISGMGTRDAALAYLTPGVPNEVVYAATFLYTAAVYWLLALFGLAFLGKQVLAMTMSRTQECKGILKDK